MNYPQIYGGMEFIEDFQSIDNYQYKIDLEWFNENSDSNHLVRVLVPKEKKWLRDQKCNICNMAIIRKNKFGELKKIPFERTSDSKIEYENTGNITCLDEFLRKILYIFLLFGSKCWCY